mgnify:CR=1 FL=1
MVSIVGQARGTSGQTSRIVYVKASCAIENIDKFSRKFSFIGALEEAEAASGSGLLECFNISFSQEE